MAYDLQEQEQLASMKAWWEKYGNFILTVATLILLAIAAYNGWRWYERREAQAAGVAYEALIKALEGGESSKVKEIAGLIVEKHPRTIYAGFAALHVAKLHYAAGDANAAKAQLRWVIDKSNRDELVATARVRLAGVLLDEKGFDEAIQLVSGNAPGSHGVVFADRRGDILAAQNKFEAARAAYQEALDKADPQHPLRNFIQLKLDALPSTGA